MWVKFSTIFCRWLCFWGCCPGGPAGYNVVHCNIDECGSFAFTTTTARFTTLFVRRLVLQFRNLRRRKIKLRVHSRCCHAGEHQDVTAAFGDGKSRKLVFLFHPSFTTPFSTFAIQFFTLQRIANETKTSWKFISYFFVSFSCIWNIITLI